MSTGISLHIGLNDVDPARYDGWNDSLGACESDADDMHAIAVAQGFDPTMLKSAQATREAVIGGIRDAADRLAAGDAFLLTYAGHGGQVYDSSGDERKETKGDMIDETWCLYDGQLLDDELRVFWAWFRPGVRVIVLSDSCHSGTVTRAIGDGKRTALDLPKEEKLRIYGTETPKLRFMPRAAAEAAYVANSEFYDGVQRDLPETPDPIHATVRLISGCNDEQFSGEAFGSGLFTRQLKRVWKGGDFTGNYDAFHAAIAEEMPDDQTPQHSVIGVPDPAFDAEQPFTI